MIICRVVVWLSLGCIHLYGLDDGRMDVDERMRDIDISDRVETGIMEIG